MKENLTQQHRGWESFSLPKQPSPSSESLERVRRDRSSARKDVENTFADVYTRAGVPLQDIQPNLSRMLSSRSSVARALDIAKQLKP